MNAQLSNHCSTPRLVKEKDLFDCLISDRSWARGELLEAIYPDKKVDDYKALRKSLIHRICDFMVARIAQSKAGNASTILHHLSFAKTIIERKAFDVGFSLRKRC